MHVQSNDLQSLHPSIDPFLFVTAFCLFSFRHGLHLPSSQNGTMQSILSFPSRSSVYSLGWLQINHHDRHVVAPNPLRRTWVVTNDLIEHLRPNLYRCLGVYPVPYILHRAFVCKTIPDAVTPDNDELVVLFQVHTVCFWCMREEKTRVSVL